MDSGAGTQLAPEDGVEPRVKRILLLIVTIAFIGFAILAWPNPAYRLIFQKLAVEAVMPYSLVCCGLIFAWIFSWHDERRWLPWLIFGVLLLHTVAGNGLVAQYLMLSLEKPFQDQKRQAQPD